MLEKPRIIENIIKSYSENVGFIVYNAEELRRIYQALGVDPKSTNRSIFDLESMSHHLQSEVVKLIKSIKISKDDVLLDAGCGNGAPTRLIAKFAGCKIIGIDINPVQIQKAIDCDCLEGVDYLITRMVMDVHTLHFEDETFDKVFHNETMCHWMNMKNALSELYRVLKKGGIMGFHDWIKGEKGDLNNAGNEFRGIYADGVWFQKDINEIKSSLEEIGFTVLHCEDTTDIVDRGLRAKLREVKMSKKYYLNSNLEDYFDKSVNYCNIMLGTHYDYLRYGRFLCAKL